MISDCLPAGSLVLSPRVWTWSETTFLALLGIQLANCRLFSLHSCVSQSLIVSLFSYHLFLRIYL